MRKIIFTVFLSTFILCLFSIDFSQNYFAKRALERDAKTLLYQFHDSLVEAQTVLNSFSSNEDLECSTEVIGKYAQLAFELPAVRLIGHLNKGDKICSSAHNHLDFDHYYERIAIAKEYQVNDNLYISTATESTGDFDLLMVKTANGNRYFASIDPFTIQNKAEFNCSDCLEYDFIIKGKPELEFRSDSMNQPSFIEYKTSRKETGLDIDLYVRGTRAFLENYKEVGYIYTFVLALLVSTLLAFLTYRLLLKRQSISNIIKEGLRYNEFQPYYQPIVDSRSGKTVGAEMLARWHRSDGSIIPPYEFIPSAERNGLIINITDQLMNKAAKDIVSLGWNETENFVSVNIVAEHLQSNMLFESVENLRKSLNLPATSISFEITERNKIENLEEAKTYLEKFYQAGFDVKLDDVGTGYGGFSYIQELGVNTLKIDKMFIDTINSSDIKNSVLGSIISFAKTLELTVIAEGVEDKKQIDYLQKRGVFLIQGFYYSRPLPFEEFQKWLSKRG